MMTLVIYDISDDHIRLRIANLCKRFGLSRIQRSAFLGSIPSSRRKELIKKLRRFKGKGNIQVFVICKPDFLLREVIGDEKNFECDDLIIV
uniref:CRISPR-associated endoribonuclease Cas2 n=1 Tax=Archaeoglobus fulgidus TaxID=2234 RepID=A0A7C3VM99_ARCFL